MTTLRRRGGPLRFIAVVVGGWVTARATLLWPLPVSTPAAVSVAAKPAARPIAPATADPSRIAFASFLDQPAAPIITPHRAAIFRTPAAPVYAGRPSDPDRVALALLGMVRFGPASEVMIPVPRRDQPRPASQPLLPADASPADRWSASVWTIARGQGGPNAGVSGRNLGGSQAGVRIAYSLDDRHRLALVTRFASPLGGPGQEAALGVEWQPTRLPVRIAVEDRIDLNSGRHAPAVGLVGGAGPVALGGNVTIEGYGQAGVIARDGIIGYVDGALRLNRRLFRLGDTNVDVGAGGWGGRQPGAGRLDVGPTLSVSVPVGGRRVRAGVEWRERVAGQAQPGSGPTLSIGADF